MSERKIKMAMSLKGTSGKKWKWHQYQARHFADTFHAMGIPSINKERMYSMMHAFAETTQSAIDTVGNALPSDVNEEVRDKIFEGLLKASKKLAIAKQL